MSNISRRRVGELQRGVFKVLLDHADGIPAKEIISRMPKSFRRLILRKAIIQSIPEFNDTER
jgi:hypothetical protein